MMNPPRLFTTDALEPRQTHSNISIAWSDVSVSEPGSRDSSTTASFGGNFNPAPADPGIRTRNPAFSLLWGRQASPSKLLFHRLRAEGETHPFLSE